MIELSDSTSIGSISDWVELYLITACENISKSKLILLLEENGCDRAEDDIDSVFSELERRTLLYGLDAPFAIDNNIAIPLKNWQQVPEYFLCLWFSYNGAYNSHAGTKLFERLSSEALKFYLYGNITVLGFPSDQALSKQLDCISNLLGENRGENPNSTVKDRGVDIIGWKSFEDSRNSQIIVLMQCAAGKNWDTKKSITKSAWGTYIHWNPNYVITSISVSSLLGSQEWKDRVHDFGMIFDRARIYRYLYQNNNIIEESLRSEVIDWCSKKLN